MANKEWNESLNTRHISTNLANYEAGRTGFFVLDVHDLTNLLSVNYTGEIDEATEADSLPMAAETLRLNVIKCPVPHFGVETLTYRRGNDVVHFAGVPTWDGGEIVVDDVVGLDTKSILMSWLYLAYNPHTRKGGRMKDYKKSATLIEYTQDYEKIREWEIEGLFITKLSEDNFDRENDGKRQISATFVFDRAIVKLPEEEEA